ncbi:MAG: hypothetical protein R3C17_06050 [Planctomycetaceae bacterium]
MSAVFSKAAIVAATARHSSSGPQKIAGPEGIACGKGMNAGAK